MENYREKLSALPSLLLPWYSANKRDLPWRETKDPYLIWVSEIMLQQTRVEAVKERYLRFIAALPDIASLAACDDEKLLKLWEGLGYYSRAKNLKKAAQRIMEQFGGSFPAGQEEIRSLPGIGDYTAGAIASIAFGKRTAAVDANVLRVAARYLPLQADIAAQKTRKQLCEQLTAIYPPAGSASSCFTQAIMELGATVCLPNGAPACGKCPLNAMCFAAKNGKQLSLPVKSPKKRRKTEHKTVFLLRCGNAFALEKRADRGLLAGMWQLPCFDEELDTKQALQKLQDIDLKPVSLCLHSGKKHIFTHIEWQMSCYSAELTHRSERFTWVTPQQLQTQYALPTAFKQFLQF